MAPTWRKEILRKPVFEKLGKPTYKVYLAYRRKVIHKVVVRNPGITNNLMAENSKLLELQPY